MSWRPAFRLPLPLSIAIGLLFLLRVAPGEATEQPDQAHVYYLPIVRVSWTPPCGGVPYLISPPDGSEFSDTFELVLDGGYRAGSDDWLEVEVSSSPGFENSLSRYFQPAGKRWEIPFYMYTYGTTQWYWRASVWCLGPGTSQPPDGYIQSPYSQTWSFTIHFFPYPPP